MDANGTHYHLLLGDNDWARVSFERLDLENPSLESGNLSLEWDKSKQAVMLKTIPFVFKAPVEDAAVSLEHRRGAGVDQFGNVYWISIDGQEILVRSSDSDLTTHFWANSDTQPESETNSDGFQTCEPQAVLPQHYAGLAITEDHYLVVGTISPTGLLVFDLHAGGAPRNLASGFQCFDICARVGGGVWILEGTLEKGSLNQPRLWGLNRDFQILSPTPLTLEIQDDLFQPLNEPKRKTFKPQTLLEQPLKPGAIALEALRQNELLILERGASPCVRHWRFGDQKETELKLEFKGLKDDLNHEFKLEPHDFVFLPDPKAPGSDKDHHALGLIYVADARGNQTFAFSLLEDQTGVLSLKLLPEFLPMRRYLGKALIGATTLSKDHCRTGVLYDFADTWLELVAQPRTRFELQGSLKLAYKMIQDTVTKTFHEGDEPDFLDGKEPNCVWHRLMLEGDFPSETSIEVWSRASDDLELLKNERILWQLEPKPLRRSNGSELPFISQSTKSNAGVLELLFQHAFGRYLQLKLKFVGNGRSSPSLRALRAYYPRFSYAKAYLPAVYREDQTSGSFLERMLANPEGLLTALEDRIASAQVLLDPQSAPQEALDWLGSWFGVALDPNWSEHKRRSFIRHAFEFFRWRGTQHGLTMALRLALENCDTDSVFLEQQEIFGVRVIENFRTRNLNLQSSSMATETQDSAEETATAHRFHVMLPVKPGSSGNDQDSRSRLEVARRVIELHKPAHTSFEVRFYWAMFRLGEARLGKDTLIDQGSRDPRLMPPITLGQGHLLEGYLAPRHPYNIPDRTVLGRDRLGS